jgi:hypothetical protein
MKKPSRPLFIDVEATVLRSDAVARPGLSVRRAQSLERVSPTLMANSISHGRFMSLNDLMTEIRTDPASFLGDEATENKVLKQVLQLVEDKISEVKNQAVKWCVEPLVTERSKY